MRLRRQLRLLAIAASFIPVAGSSHATSEPGLCLASTEVVAHGGGLNACGCHFNRKTGGCHCHQPRGCGCECQPAGCR